jgi:acyl-CoA hydrolase
MINYPVMTAEEAARLIKNDYVLGIGGFSSVGVPKAVPAALAKYAIEEHEAGRPFQVGLITGGATGPAVDTDLPFMRVAEAYLTYAEASIRLGGPNAKANEYINALRKRANAKQEATYALDDVIKEWSKEFWFEGRRRMDLIRFNMYGGQSKYTWEFMGGIASGAQFPAYRNVYPLPDNDLTNNENLKQNAGY